MQIEMTACEHRPQLETKYDRFREEQSHISHTRLFELKRSSRFEL